MQRYEKYKDSGIEWIGEIPEHWEVKKINYCFSQIGSGTTPIAGKTEYYENGEFNWLQTGDLTNDEIVETSKRITQKALDEYSTLRFYPVDSVVIAMYGATIGKTGILKIESTTNQACCVLAKPKDFISKYAFYCFNSMKEHIISLSYGGGQPNISQELIRNLRIQIPLISEQTTIASFLDRKTAEIDQIIAKKQKLIALYEEEKQAIINQAVTKGLDPNIKLKDSGVEWLGEIPEGWEVKKLKYIIKVNSGEGIKSEDIKPVGDFPVYGGNGIVGYTNTFNSKDDDIIIGRVGAKCGNVRLVSGEKWISDNALVATAISDTDIYFLTIQLQLMDLNNMANQNAQPLITGTMVKNSFIAVPNKNEQIEIVKFLNSECSQIETIISKFNKQIDLLQEYRTTLISEVVTGKIKVCE